MLLGKRPRPPMKRTTSLSEISFDLGHEQQASHQSPDQQTNHTGNRPKQMVSGAGAGVGVGADGVDKLRNNLHRRHSADFLETPHFLKACGLCKRSLVPDRDIYIYRGDSAFCSLECRQQQMNQDERREKCSYASAKKQASSTTTA